MLGGERGDLMMQAIEEAGPCLDEQRISALMGETVNASLMSLSILALRSSLLSHDADVHTFCIGFSNRILRVDQKGDPCR